MRLLITALTLVCSFTIARALHAGASKPSTPRPQTEFLYTTRANHQQKTLEQSSIARAHADAKALARTQAEKQAIRQALEREEAQVREQARKARAQQQIQAQAEAMAQRQANA